MEVHPFTADQTGCVQELLNREYSGYPYPVECRPEHVSCVALHEREVYAFARARRDHAFGDAHVYEFGTAIVAPESRVRGTMRALARRITEEAWARGAHWQHTEMVTFRPGIQRVLPDVGFQFCGLELGKHPQLRAEMGRQPESVFFAVARPDGVIRRHGEVFLPDDYTEIIASYLPTFLGATHSSLEDEQLPDPHYHAPYVREGISGAEFVDVAVNAPSALQTIQALRAQGWSFSGVLPGMLRTKRGRVCDGLRLQRLAHGSRFDHSIVQAIHPVAVTLRQHVLSHLLH